MSQATYEKLKVMRLGAMAEAYQQQLSDPEIQQLSFEERLTLLTDIEWNQRKSNKVTRLINQAHFDYG